jgi:hypothetical protein
VRAVTAGDAFELALKKLNVCHMSHKSKQKWPTNLILNRKSESKNNTIQTTHPYKTPQAKMKSSGSGSSLALFVVMMTR